MPPNGKLVKQAGKEFAKLDLGEAAALAEAFGRVCRGTQKRDEDEDLPLGKGRKLRAVRKSYQSASLRLVYARVAESADDGDKGEIVGDEGGEASADIVPDDERHTAICLGLYAWSKKRNDMPNDIGETAWVRLQAWLNDNPGFEQC